jgi:hypothetical protein
MKPIGPMSAVVKPPMELNKSAKPRSLIKLISNSFAARK